MLQTQCLKINIHDINFGSLCCKHKNNVLCTKYVLLNWYMILKIMFGQVNIHANTHHVYENLYLI